MFPRSIFLNEWHLIVEMTNILFPPPRQHDTDIKLYTNVPSMHRLMKLAFDIVELNLILNIKAMPLNHKKKTKNTQILK